MSESSPQSKAVEQRSGLSRSAIRRALRLWTVEAGVATVHGTLTGGAFQTGFAIYLGCNDFIISVLAAIPAFAGLLQLVSSYFAQRFGHRKELVMGFSVVGRMLWIPMLLIPLGLLPQNLWVAGFLLLTLLSSAFLSIAAPLWTAWISDIVPDDYRGRYFGQRNMYAGFVGMVASIVAGAYFDTATKQHHMAQPHAFAILFGLGSVFGLMCFVCGCLSPAAEDQNANSNKAQEEPHSWETIRRYYAQPFADRNFRRIMIFFVGVVIAQSIAGQFFVVSQLKYLKLDYTAFQLLAAVASLSSLLTMPLWGYLADKYGNKPMLMISCVMVLIPPFLWLLTFPDNIPGLWMVGAHGEILISYCKLVIIVLNLIAGMGWAGVGLTQFNMMIGAAPAEHRTVYVSAVAAVTGLAGGIAPLVGGAILSVLSHVTFPNHGLVRNGYHVLFILSGLLRALFLLWIRSIDEVGSTTPGYVLGQLKATKPFASMASIRTLSRGNNAVTRQRAAESLARLKTPVAVEELVLALDDVSLPVREKAAIALGEIGDPRAITALIQRLTDPASGIEGIVATALGKIGDSQALPALAAAAQLGPSSRQLAALQALGQLSDPRVTEILITFVSSPDVAVRTAALRALAEREDPKSEGILTERLMHESQPATVAVIADALGRIASRSSATPLLAALERSISPTVRRTIINALGSVAVGRDALYPMLALDAYGRDDVVTKILMGIQKRYRTQSGPGTTGYHSARISIRAKQALLAYTSNHSADCIAKIAQLARLLPIANAPGDKETALLVVCALDNIRQKSGHTPSPEETLLAVFLIRYLAE